MERFAKLLLRQDRLGQTFSLNYKGNDMHPTYLGSVLSIATTVIVLIYLGIKTVEMATMKEPTVLVANRPILDSEIEEAGQMLLKDYGMYIAFDVLS